MDIEQINRWRELAQKFYGKDFWSSVFDSDYTKEMMNMMGDAPSMQSGPNSIPNPTYNPNPSPTSNPTQNRTSNPTPASNPIFPRVDLLKDQHEMIVLIELPGVLKNEIQLGLVGNELHIRGNVMSRYPDTTILHSERYYGPFDRIIPLPESIEKGRISAKFEEGILEIRCPRAVVIQEQIQID